MNHAIVHQSIRKLVFSAKHIAERTPLQRNGGGKERKIEPDDKLPAEKIQTGSCLIDQSQNERSNDALGEEAGAGDLLLRRLSALQPNNRRRHAPTGSIVQSTARILQPTPKRKHVCHSGFPTAAPRARRPGGSSVASSANSNKKSNTPTTPLGSFAIAELQAQ